MVYGSYGPIPGRALLVRREQPGAESCSNDRHRNATPLKGRRSDSIKEQAEISKAVQAVQSLTWVAFGEQMTVRDTWQLSPIESGVVEVDQRAGWRWRVAMQRMPSAHFRTDPPEVIQGLM
jgi:hypothetical protein